MDLNLRDKAVFITGASSGISATATKVSSAEGSDGIVVLASPSNSFMTGATIDVNDGCDLG